MPPFPRPTPRFDHGFTLVELLVVMAIITILGGISVAGFRHVRMTSDHHHAILVARTYDEVVGAFLRDHDGRPPDPAHVTPEWPAAAAIQGPLDVLRGRDASSTSNGEPYLRKSIPEDVQVGDFGIRVARGGSTARGTTGKTGVITYTYDLPTATYDIVATVGSWSCYLGTSARAIQQRGASC